jgi:hypothetical protein
VEWIVTNWAPRAIASGLTHFANVVSPDSLAAGSARAMSQGLKGQLNVQQFGDLAEAHRWLREAQRRS